MPSRLVHISQNNTSIGIIIEMEWQVRPWAVLRACDGPK